MSRRKTTNGDMGKIKKPYRYNSVIFTYLNSTHYLMDWSLLVILPRDIMQY
ncbi:hypothetical protein BSPLISOX_1100 [uncultured Gammaproteobacteria bacterium]|nr:hypothetical protein [uncultured Gammaproteobacteria bacterium]CAC9461059.1 hypothetical protein [uncultured Gammaproteobacteria bacterium]VVH67368.1 hypothetical protein BSPLISOX_1100 [uncultured Gammaproteobacteria bacterium]